MEIRNGVRNGASIGGIDAKAAFEFCDELPPHREIRDNDRQAKCQVLKQLRGKAAHVRVSGLEGRNPHVCFSDASWYLLVINDTHVTGMPKTWQSRGLVQQVRRIIRPIQLEDRVDVPRKKSHRLDVD